MCRRDCTSGIVAWLHIKKYASSVCLKDLNISGELDGRGLFRPGTGRTVREEDRFHYWENNVGKSTELDLLGSRKNRLQQTTGDPKRVSEGRKNRRVPYYAVYLARQMKKATPKQRMWPVFSQLTCS